MLYGGEGDLIRFSNILPHIPELCALIAAGTWRNDSKTIQEMARLELLDGDELAPGVSGVAQTVIEMRKKR